MILMWETVEKNVEAFVADLGIPEIGVSRTEIKEDILPTDPSNISGQDLSTKLFEYSAYVSYLDAELGRLDSLRTAISSELEGSISRTAHTNQISRPKAKTLLLGEQKHLNEAEQRLVELDSTYARIVGLRDGYSVRLQACSRELTRRTHQV